MAIELAVRTPFGLGKKMYAIGERVTDKSEIEAIETERARFVRRINVSAPKAASAPAKDQGVSHGGN